MIEYTFFQNALAGIILVSIASAIVGTLVVARRMVFLTGGITHASFGGLGLGFYAGWNPVVTAALFAVGSALGIEALTARQGLRRDSATGVVWAVGMALGVVFIFLTPGYVPELTSFLFGNVLTITRGDLIAMAIYTVVLVALLALGYRYVLLCAFDSDFARTRSLPVTAVNTAMTIMIAVCIVLTIRMIGVMLLMSLFTLPQLVAEQWTRRLHRMMALAAAVSLACALAGLWLSAAWPVPASATIVLLLVAAYIISRLLRRLKS